MYMYMYIHMGASSYDELHNRFGSWHYMVVFPSDHA